MHHSPDGDEISALTARPERLLNFVCGKYVVVSSGQGGGSCLLEAKTSCLNRKTKGKRPIIIYDQCIKSSLKCWF